jgi:hypothetical protein
MSGVMLVEDPTLRLGGKSDQMGCEVRTSIESRQTEVCREEGALFGGADHRDLEADLAMRKDPPKVPMNSKRRL